MMILSPILMDQASSSISGVAPASAAVNRATLDQYLQSAYSDDPQPEIHLQPNRLAKYDTVAMVLADAQRIGVTHIGFTGIETMQ